MKSLSKKLQTMKAQAVVGYSDRLLVRGNIVLFCVALMFSATWSSCKKHEKLPGMPTVTTAAITDLTPYEAKGGGSIVSDGGALITASGLAYSTTNGEPTIEDDTTKTAVITGTFTSQIKNLASNKTYFIRAYATNKAGTGYGQVMSFATGNAAPVALNVTINGEIKGDTEVTAVYTYMDKEGDTESGTTFQWYRADNAAGLNTVAISGATKNKYRISVDDAKKVLWVGVIPKAIAGTQLGLESVSAKTSPIGEVTTVTFMYNGNLVTYGIIESQVTGKRWLDRNLGAPNTPAAHNDWANYGDLFQWGRGADGHQLTVRAASNAATTSVNGTTDVLAASNTPGNKFITASTTPFDWQATPNSNLWQGVNGINNPCPAGWRIPTKDEWSAEAFGDNQATNFAKLKLTFTGYRINSGAFSAVTFQAKYWTSTVGVSAAANLSYVFDFFTGSTPEIITDLRGRGCVVRCIKDNM